MAELFTWVNMRFLLQGLGMTLAISAVSILCSIALGTVISVLRTSKNRALSGVATVYIEVFKNTPLLAVDHVHVLRGPAASARRGRVGVHTVHQRQRAEIVRGGLAGVPFGQYEAARSQGFNVAQTYALIILPQALRNMIPALLSQFVTTVKDTSFCGAPWPCRSLWAAA